MGKFFHSKIRDAVKNYLISNSADTARKDIYQACKAKQLSTSMIFMLKELRRVEDAETYK